MHLAHQITLFTLHPPSFVLRPSSFLLLLLLSSTAAAQHSTPDPIQSARDSLARGGRFPWYDRQNDDVRKLRILPRVAEPERGDKWADDSTAPTPPTPPDLTLFGKFLQWFGLTTLVLLLGLIAFMIAKGFLRDEVSEDALAVRKIVESRRDADRVEALPFHVRAASGDFLAEARRLYEAGQYSQAIVYLFSYQLVQLDRRHVIRLAKGKTNRQYVRETRKHPHLAAILEITMVTFEDAFFGRKTITREAFERSWQRLDEFQADLSREELAAA
jgi:Domain of unknown function (DUF4129)